MMKEPNINDLLPEEQEKVIEGEARIEVPEDQEKEESKQIFLEASELVVHIPKWVHPQHGIYYKVAYLQVKKDENTSRLPARVRTALIRQLMNKMITKMRQFFIEEQKKKEQEVKNGNRRF